SGGGTETYDSEEFQNTINGPPPMASSSVISTPAAGNGNKSNGKGVLSTEGQLTLREQEQARPLVDTQVTCMLSRFRLSTKSKKRILASSLRFSSWTISSRKPVLK